MPDYNKRCITYRLCPETESTRRGLDIRAEGQTVNFLQRKTFPYAKFISKSMLTRAYRISISFYYSCFSLLTSLTIPQPPYPRLHRVLSYRPRNNIQPILVWPTSSYRLSRRPVLLFRHVGKPSKSVLFRFTGFVLSRPFVIQSDHASISTFSFLPFVSLPYSTPHTRIRIPLPTS